MRRAALSESEAALSARPKSSCEVQREATRLSGAVRHGPVRPRVRPAGSYARRARPARAVLSAAGSLDFPSSDLEAIRLAGAVAPRRCDPVSASRSGAGLRRRSAHAAWLQRHLQPRSSAVAAPKTQSPSASTAPRARKGAFSGPPRAATASRAGSLRRGVRCIRLVRRRTAPRAQLRVP